MFAVEVDSPDEAVSNETAITRPYRVSFKMLYLITLLIFPYACFVFCGEGFNPFSRPHNPTKRKQWRRGRWMALAALLGMTTTVILFSNSSESLIVTLAIGVGFSLIFAAAFSARKISEYFWG